MGRGLKVTFAVTAKVNSGLLGDTLGDVHLVPHTVRAHVGRIGRDQGATYAAQARMAEYESRDLGEGGGKGE